MLCFFISALDIRFSSVSKDVFHFINRFYQLVYFAVGIIQIEAGSGGRRQAEFLMQWHGAMVPGADGDPVAIVQNRCLEYKFAFKAAIVKFLDEVVNKKEKT